MKKIIWLVILLALFTFTFFACDYMDLPTEIIQPSPIIPHIHAWTEIRITEYPTCTEKGTRKGTCTCGETTTWDIDALGHTPIVDKAVAPTCSVAGLTEGKHCSACSEILIAQETVPSLPHTPGAEATCTTSQYCTVCYTELDMAWGHWEVIDAAISPTCTEPGLTEGAHCGVCAEVLQAQVAVDPRGHTPGTAATCVRPQQCRACSTVLNPAKGHTLVNTSKIFWNEEVYCVDCHTECAPACGIVACLSFDELNMYANGLKVADAFTPGASILWDKDTTVENPSIDTIRFWGWVGTIEQIGQFGYRINNGAAVFDDGWTVEAETAVVNTALFMGASYVSRMEIMIPVAELTETSTVTVLYQDCDGAITMLERFTVRIVYPDYEVNADGITCTVTGIGDCEGAEIVIPEYIDGYRVTAIKSTAFRDCTDIISVTIPDGVTSIGSSAFRNCTGLRSIVIPDSVTSIGGWAFSGCTGLISVALGQGVTVIGEYAFQDCSGLTSFTIPDGVSDLDYGIFDDCSSLSFVVIPDSVTSMSSNTFTGCDSLTFIQFEGTVSQWNAIKKVWKWNMYIPATAVVCSDGSVKLF